MRSLIFILTLFLSYHAGARILTVGTNRSYADIRLAIRAAVKGDTIEVYPGTYRHQNLVVDKAVVLLGIGYPILDGENKYEIISVKSDDVTISGFALRNSGISSLEDISGIKLYNVRDVTISKNKLDNSFFGIYAQNCFNCSIEDNILIGEALSEQQSGNGIHCWKSDSMKIVGNTVRGHRDGIYFEFVKNSIIWRNISDRNIRYGLHFMFSNDDTYVSNVFTANGSGVSVMFSKHIRMFSNYFEENWGDASHGILLKEISDGYMQGNYFEKNTSAVYMEGANRIAMRYNSFRNNGWALKIQASCMDVELEHNNFIGNTFDVGTNGSLVQNRFNENYWDKYEGYDLDRNGKGDIAYRPVSMYSMIVEKYPTAMILFRSFITVLLDKTEKVLPSLTPENLKDDVPLMRKAF